MKKLILAAGCVLVLAFGWLVKKRLSFPTLDVTPTAVSANRSPAAPKPTTATPTLQAGSPSAMAAVSAATAASAAEQSKRSAHSGPTPGPIPLHEVLQPGNRYFDARYGVAATYPDGWVVREAQRWGVNDGENTVFFDPPPGSEASPSMYYRKYGDGPAFDMTNPEATLRDMARQKETSRSSSGENDYKNDPESFVFRTIDGHPSLSYFATYTNGGQVQAEYFLRILGDNGYVMFFTRGPARDVQTLIPAIFEMGSTVKPP